MADLGRPGALLEPFRCPPGALLAALAPLGALLAALRADLGPLGPLLGPPEPLLGLMLASRGALVGAFWISVFQRPCKKAKTLIFADSSSLFEFF